MPNRLVIKYGKKGAAEAPTPMQEMSLNIEALPGTNLYYTNKISATDQGYKLEIYSSTDNGAYYDWVTIINENLQKQVPKIDITSEFTKLEGVKIAIDMIVKNLDKINDIDDSLDNGYNWDKDFRRKYITERVLPELVTIHNSIQAKQCDQKGCMDNALTMEKVLAKTDFEQMWDKAYSSKESPTSLVISITKAAKALYRDISGKSPY